MSPITPAYIYVIQSMEVSFHYLWYGTTIYTTVCRQMILTLRKSMYERASRKFLHFHVKKLLFLSIFCWYFRNFVGTNGILVGLHVPTDFQMYRQNSEKALGGNCTPAPPPPLWLR